MGSQRTAFISSSSLLFDFDCYILKSKLKMSGEWKHGIFGCLANCRTCLCGTFLPCCLICETSRKMGKSGVLYNILGCFAPCIPIVLLRQDARMQHNIEGSCLGDVCCSICCLECALCQVANQVQ